MAPNDKYQERHLTFDVSRDESDGMLRPGVDDLTRETKVVIGQYMCDLGSPAGSSEIVRKNKYPALSTWPDGEFDITANDGLPIRPKKTVGDVAQPAFVRYVEELRDVSFTHAGASELREGDYFKRDGAFPLSSNEPIFSKGRRLDVYSKDGNDLLRDVPEFVAQDGDEPESAVLYKKYVSPVLKRNRFHPSVVAGQFYSTFPTYFEIPGTPGKWTDGDGNLNSTHQALKVGAILSNRASEEMSSLNVGYNPESGGAYNAAILPSLNQLGVKKVNVDNFNARDVLREASVAELDPKIIDVTSESWGAFNNTNDKFDAALPMGMLLTAIGMTLAFRILMFGILKLLSLLMKTFPPGETHDAYGNRYLGTSSTVHDAPKLGFPPVPLPSFLFGLLTTRAKFDDAVNEGLNQFLGDLTPTGILTGAKLTLQSPAFYVLFMRNIARSGMQLVPAFEDMLAAFGKGIACGVEAIFSLINVFKTSKLIAAINIFAQIGDGKILADAKRAEIDVGGGQSRTSTIDKIAFDTGGRAPAIMMNRIYSPVSGIPRQCLAWGANTSPALLMLPKAFVGAILHMPHGSKDSKNVNIPFNALSYVNTQFGKSETESVGSVDRSLNYAMADASVPRLSIGDAHRMEAMLDAEYVPFYFHDLRTNEIIGFHAFLQTLNESFSPTWSDSDGYGRIDAVSIYKNTSRSLSVSFFVAATNPTDFDAMWVKINKLVTMVYPQWSKGKQVSMSSSGGTNAYVQPFSQVITASPIIRLRIGDLIRSNYSKFALMRIFGLGNAAFGNKSKDENAALKALEKSADATLENVKKEQNHLSKGSGYRFVEAGAMLFEEVDNPTLSISISTTKNTRRSISTLADEPVKILKEGDTTSIVEFAHERDVPKYIEEYNKQNVKRWVVNNKDIIRRMPREKLAKIDDINLDHFLNMDDEDNSIVRSFNETSGKGVAGTIRSLSFDWHPNGPWSTDTYGSRAPTVAIVTFQFSVIHDIAPGLDCRGMDRAPVFNVGSIMNEFNGDSWDENNIGRATYNAVRSNVTHVDSVVGKQK